MASDDRHEPVTGATTQQLVGAAPHRGQVAVGTTTSREDVHEAVTIPLDDLFMHAFSAGETGTGKSQLMVHAALQVIEAGWGAVFLDPKTGDAVDDLLGKLPDGRVDDVIYVNPAAALEAVPAMNVLEPYGVQQMDATARDLQVSVLTEMVVGVIRQQSESWGARFGRVLEAVVRALVTENSQIKLGRRDDALRTLGDVYDVVDDAERREQVIDRTDNRYVRNGLIELHSDMSAKERHPLRRRLADVLTPTALNTVLTEPQGTLDIRRVLDGGKILLVDVSGVEATVAAVFGAVVVAQAWAAAQARNTVPLRERRPAMLFVDELKTFVGATAELGTMLSEARAFRLGLWLATQYPQQIPTDVRRELYRNARTTIVFPGPEDTQGTPSGALRGVPPHVVQDAEGHQYRAVVNRIDEPAIAADTLPPWDIDETVIEERVARFTAADDAAGEDEQGADREDEYDDAGGAVGAVEAELNLGNEAVAGDDEHQRLLHVAQAWFEERGASVDLLYQRGNRSRPDAVLEVDGEIWHVEVECGTVSKPARVLQNLRRAHDADRTCVFVVPAKKVDRVVNIVTDPVNRRGDTHVDDHGTYSYYQSEGDEVTDVDELQAAQYVVYAAMRNGLERVTG